MYRHIGRATVIAAGLIAFQVQSMSSDAAAQESNKTEFRGLAIDQSIAEVEAVAAEAGWQISQQPDEHFLTGEVRGTRIEISANSELCGIVQVDLNGFVRRMEFWTCYFNAGNMAVKEFARSILENYRVPRLDLQWVTTNEACPNGYPSYRGRAATGEAISVDDFCVGGVSVVIERAAVMTFN